MPELLEVHEPDGAFARIEGWLRREGSSAPRATASSLTCTWATGFRSRSGVAPSRHRRSRAARSRWPRAGWWTTSGATSRGSFEIGAWEQTWTGAEYGAAVEDVRAAIARGDVYQVNLVQHLRAPFTGSPRELARRLGVLRPLQPAPFVTDTWSVVSASPELFLSRRGNRLRTMPIKGTRPRGEAAELRDSEKDAAEHVMIVDLERNDLSRVCEPGSIRWPELMETHALAGVEHMVSTVEGTLRPGVGLGEILEATFPGGSVTGAPKIAAVDLIAELEPVGRGASMGALGRVHGNGDVDLALTIRTFVIAEGSIHLWVGGGVVWDSDPGRGGRGVVDEGLAAARGRRLAHAAGGALVTTLALAVTGRGLVDPTEPVIRADDEGLLRGRAAFETLRVYGGRPFALEAHLDRLTASAASIGLPAVERRRAAGAGRARPPEGGPRGRAPLRLVWTAGPAGGLPSALALMSTVPDWIEATRERGATAVSLLGVRASAPWLLPGVKSTSYAVNMAAEAEARRLGADEALFVDGDGVVLEGTVTNVWWRAGETSTRRASTSGSWRA